MWKYYHISPQKCVTKVPNAPDKAQAACLALISAQQPDEKAPASNHLKRLWHSLFFALTIVLSTVDVANHLEIGQLE